MAEYTRVIATDITFPNMTVYRLYRDGTHYGYNVYANEGYVMYDTTAEDYELDPVTMQQRPVTYYYTMAGFPLNYNFANFTWVAVPRDSVDENYIYGGGDNDHEVM